MRKSIMLLVIMVALGGTMRAQSLSDRTNAVRLDFKNPVTPTTLAQINWVSPSREYSSSEENRVNINVNVTSMVPLKNVRVSVMNSLEQDSPPSFNVDLETPNLASVERSVFMEDGQHYVRVEAENQDGGTVVDFRSILVGMDALKDAIAMDRKDYALLFATDQYDNYTDLVNPVFDATAIGKELEERYGFEVRIVKNAKQDEVFNILREYAQLNYKPQDQLLVFFAGHGEFDDVFGEGYVVASDSRANDPGKTSYISHNRLRNNINNIPCDHISLVMDVCFGGTFDPVLASSRSVYAEVDNMEYIAKKLNTRTRKFLTSGSKEYVSDGTPGKHSPFALRLLEALKTGGGEDRLLTLSEINLTMQKLQTTPRFGPFGNDEAGSEFLFIGNLGN